MSTFKTIPVNRGKFTQFPKFIKVSTRDYSKLSKYKWQLNPKGYAFTTGSGLGAGLTATGKPKATFAHQYVSRRAEKGIGFYTDATGSRKLEVDHINRQRNDDRRENLRQVTKAQNLANRGVSRSQLGTGFRNKTTLRINDLLSGKQERSLNNQLSAFQFGAKSVRRTASKAHTKANYKTYYKNRRAKLKMKK